MTTEKRPGTDLDDWCWQLQVLADLAQFVQRHGPSSASPLPILNWTLGTGRQASAELFAHTDDDPVTVLHLFAKVLGVNVEARHLPNKVAYWVRGWIGKKEGTKQQPRTALLIRATVFHPLEDEEAGR